MGYMTVLVVAGMTVELGMGRSGMRFGGPRSLLEEQAVQRLLDYACGTPGFARLPIVVGRL